MRLYSESVGEVRALVTAAPALRGVATYADIEWRLDVRTASRALSTEAEPVFLVKLHTEGAAPGGGGNSGGGGDGGGSGGGGGSQAGLSKYCSPRQPPSYSPSSIDLHSIL